MTHANDPHAPTPEFRAHLRWQVETALRRESRFAAPVRDVRGLPVAVMLLLALATGGAAGIASEHVQDARQREGLIENAQAEERLLRTRLELARADYEDARKRFEVGLAGQETVLAAQRQLRAMEAELTRVRLDIAEIQATSTAPRNELHAPLVQERDFVRDRMMLELETAQRNMAAAEEQVRRVRQRVEIGTASRAAQLQGEAEVARARAMVERVRAMLELRSRFLRQELGQEEVAAAARRAELNLLREQVARELETLRKRLAELKRQTEAGLAAELDVKRAEVELLEREIDLRRIQRELEALRTKRR